MRVIFSFYPTNIKTITREDGLVFMRTNFVPLLNQFKVVENAQIHTDECVFELPKDFSQAQINGVKLALHIASNPSLGIKVDLITPD